MNRNNEVHFAMTPTAEISRSKFERPYTVKTAFNEGDIVPIFCQQYVPGDTIKMRMSDIIRMTTPIVPVMDNCVADVYFFNVPWRLIWEHTKQFVGENDSAPWASNVEYEIPQIIAPEQGWEVGSLADHLGEPISIGGLSTSALKFRAYCEIYNQWFRSQPLQAPVYIHKDDATTYGVNASTVEEWNDVEYAEKGGKLLKACKTFDYFTSCLPSAQAGPAVSIPISTGNTPVKFTDAREGDFGYKYDGAVQLTYTTGTTPKNQWSEHYTFTQTDPVDGIITESDGWSALSTGTYYPYIDLTQATGATVTQLRQAFAIQKFYERSGMVGLKYGDVIKGHFSVTNPDYRNMIPEYLGGFRSNISINQVVQTSATDGVTPQGNTAAYSVTVDRKDDLFTKSFTEWGIIMGVVVCRVANHSYQQGQNREWSKKKRFDFYWPEFANLSNQAVLNKEIYAQGNQEDNEAFGYQEAWAEMRYSPDEIHSTLRDNAPQPLSIWQYADYYDERPTLSSEWIKEGERNIGKTLAVQNQPQFIADFYFGAIWTRPLPVYSIPGLIDHH